MTDRIDGGGIASQWLRAETTEHMRLLSRLRGRLEAKLDRLDEAARKAGVPLDAIPDRDWCRALQRYQQGYTTLLVEERERAKLAIAARLKGGDQVLSDEEFSAGLRELGVEALKELPAADLAAELARRGINVPVVSVDDEDQDE